MRIALIFLPLLYCFTAFSQSTKGTITINITGKENELIDEVYLNLIDLKDSSIAKISLSEKNGSAVIDDVRFGKYYLTATKPGYEKYISATIIVDESHLNISLPTIQLTAISRSLEEVEITYKKPLIERQFDKIDR